MLMTLLVTADPLLERPFAKSVMHLFQVRYHFLRRSHFQTNKPVARNRLVVERGSRYRSRTSANDTRFDRKAQQWADPHAGPQTLEDEDDCGLNTRGDICGGRGLTESGERMREDPRPGDPVLLRPRNGRPEAFRSNAARYSRAQSRPEEEKAVL